MAAERTAHGTTRMSAARDAKRMKKIRIAPAANGGYVVTHHYFPANGHGTPSTETHAFSDYAGVHHHLSGLKH